MSEQELIDTINALIDEGVQGKCTVLNPKDIARRAIDQCGEDVSTIEAVTDLTIQILSARCEPWKWPPGARPHLKSRKDGISRLIPKPSVAELLEAGRQAGEPFGVTLARVRLAYPKLEPAALQAKVESYAAWLRESGDDLRREMERLGARIDGHG